MSVRQKMSSEERQAAQSGGLMVGPGQHFSFAKNPDAFLDVLSGGTIDSHIPSIAEPKGYTLGYEGMLDAVMPNMDEKSLNHAIETAFPSSSNERMPSKTASKNKPVKSGNDLHISKKQVEAIKKFPALVEFLGSEEGEIIARKIADELVSKVADRVGANSKSIDDRARFCLANGRNIKQIFDGDKFLHMVIASGPFTGNEAILHNQKTDMVNIVRLSAGEDGNVKQTDVTKLFNVIVEAEEKSVDNA